MSEVRRHSIRRDALLQALRDSKEHPSAEMLYQELLPAFPELSLGTVYRNLTQLKESGEIVSIAVVNGHERFDSIKSDHAHFICRNCSRIFDLWETEQDLKVAEAANAAGFEVQSQEILLRGLCNECRTHLQHANEE